MIAASELRLALAESGCGVTDGSARGLLELIQGRRNPAGLLGTLSSRLAAGESVSTSDLASYTQVLDDVVWAASTPDFPLSRHIDPVNLFNAGDMTAWISPCRVRMRAP